MKTLNLIIKQCFFDEIIKGTKKQEFREVKPTTIKRLVQLDKDGYEVEDENGNAIPIQYDALQLKDFEDNVGCAYVTINEAIMRMMAESIDTTSTESQYKVI
jgi:hypothetical protein